MGKSDKCSHAVRIMRIRDMLENRPFVTIKSLEQEFGVCRKTVYNDLEALQSAGVPLFSEMVDGEARWMIQHHAKSKTVTMTLGEGQVLPLGLAQLALSFLKGTDLHDQLGVIQQKLALGVKPRTKKLLEEVPRKLALVPHGPKIYQHKDDILNDLLTGLLYDERVQIGYRPPGGQTKRHLIEPLTLVLYREALYVIARVRKTGLRTCFAVDRITRSERRKGDHFEYPANHDPRDYFDGAFGLLVGEPSRVEIVFEAQQARYVRERQWHPTQQFEDLEQGRVRMTMEVRGTDDVLRWLIGHSGTFEVVSPRDLRDKVCDCLRAGLEAHRRCSEEAAADDVERPLPRLVDPGDSPSWRLLRGARRRAANFEPQHREDFEQSLRWIARLGDLGLLTRDEVIGLDREYSASREAIEVSMHDMQCKMVGPGKAFWPWKPPIYLAAAICKAAAARTSHQGYGEAIRAAFERGARRG
jgi:proteasome accessory factor B